MTRKSARAALTLAPEQRRTLESLADSRTVLNVDCHFLNNNHPEYKRLTTPAIARKNCAIKLIAKGNVFKPNLFVLFKKNKDQQTKLMPSITKISFLFMALSVHRVTAF